MRSLIYSLCRERWEYNAMTFEKAKTSGGRCALLSCGAFGRVYIIIYTYIGAPLFADDEYHVRYKYRYLLCVSLYAREKKKVLVIMVISRTLTFARTQAWFLTLLGCQSARENSLWEQISEKCRCGIVCNCFWNCERLLVFLFSFFFCIRSSNARWLRLRGSLLNYFCCSRDKQILI